MRCQSGEVGETSYVCTFYKLRDCPPTPYLLAHVILDACYVTSEMEVGFAPSQNALQGTVLHHSAVYYSRPS